MKTIMDYKVMGYLLSTNCHYASCGECACRGLDNCTGCNSQYIDTIVSSENWAQDDVEKLFNNLDVAHNAVRVGTPAEKYRDYIDAAIARNHEDFANDPKLRWTMFKYKLSTL